MATATARGRLPDDLAELVAGLDAEHAARGQPAATPGEACLCSDRSTPLASGPGLVIGVQVGSTFSGGTLVAGLARVSGCCWGGRIVQAVGTAVMLPLLMTTVLTLVPAAAAPPWARGAAGRAVQRARPLARAVREASWSAFARLVSPTSPEVGVAKPDPAIFALADVALGVAPSEVVSFDDQPEHEFAAAD